MELWKDIIDFPNYEVSNLGNVRNKLRGNILKPKSVTKSEGFIYHEVYITHTDGKQKHKSIHRLVANAFIPNPENKPQVDHIDRNPLNNKLDNLRWATQSENNRNTKVRIDSISGHKGIRYCPESWVAKYFANNKEIHIGKFKTIEEAIKARDEYIANL